MTRSSANKRTSSTSPGRNKGNNGNADGDEDDEVVSDDDTPQRYVPRVLHLAKQSHWPAVETVCLQLIKSGDISDLHIRDKKTGMTLMMYSCKDNRRATFEILFQLGFNINDRAKDGMTALHYAVTSTAETIVERLIKHDADTTAIGGPLQQLPLHIACSRMSMALTLSKYILKKMPPECRLILDANGNMPIVYAVESGLDQLVGELLQQLPTEQTNGWRQRKTKNTLLHLAAMRRDAKTAAVLASVCDVDAQNSKGQTALHIAASNSDFAFVSCLHDFKANANIKDKSEESASYYAVRVGCVPIVKFLADKMHADVQLRVPNGSTLMHLAAEFGHDTCITALWKRDVPLHMPNKAGLLSLHMAASNGFPSVVQALLAAGAPIDARTRDRYTPMHLAVLYNKPEVIQVLMGLGASVSVQGGPAGEMPLHIAARTNAVECAKMLLLTGAQVDAPTGADLETPLHVVARRGYARLFELLLQEGADVHLLSRSGESVLHIACRHCHYSIVRLVLSHIKAKYTRKDAVKLVNLQSNEGESPLHLACGLSETISHYPLEDVDIVSTLLKYSADPLSATRHTHEIPMHYCARVGNLNIILEIARHMDYNFPPLTNRQAKNGWSPLLTACYNGHSEVVDFLTRNNARVDLFDEQGLAALHLAAEKGFIKCCELLLEKKAFVNLKTKVGITPLHLAAANGFNDLVKLLVEKYGATVDIISFDKKTPLHVAAENGRKDVARTLVNFGANVHAVDALGQTPLHLAAECDHSEVVEMFLKFKPELVFSANQDGMTCAHIAAAKGSVGVIKELMRFNRSIVISARNKTTDSLPLHLAAEGGHGDVVRILLDAGSPPLSENIDGMTCLHLAAKEGHTNVLAAIPSTFSWSTPSAKTGLTALHVAAFYNKTDFMDMLLRRVKPDAKSARPSTYEIKDEKLKSLIMIDYGFTALHVASYAGRDLVIRLLLNLPEVDVEARTATSMTTPLHLAAQTGSLAVSSLLLSQSSTLLRLQDLRGLKPLHLAARNGHSEMVASLISQGSDINTSDNLGWVPLHHACRCGQLGVVKLLLELGASVTHATRDDRVPLSLSAASGQVDVFMYLLSKEHNTNALLDDKKFVLDLMICGRTNQQRAIEEFILVSESPLETASQLAFLFWKRAENDIEHAKDLDAAGSFCEKVTSSLMAIASAMTSPSQILRAIDGHGKAFIDILVDDNMKNCVANPSVQRYLTEVWEGDLGLGNSSLLLLFIAFVLCPPVLFYCSLPFGQNYYKVPIIKFMVYAASHIQFIIVLSTVAVSPLYPMTTRDSFMPTWNEYLLMLFLGGNLTAELTNPVTGIGGRIVKALALGLSSVAMFFHLLAVIYPIDSYEASMFMYVRNLTFSFPVMISVLYILEILTFSKSFGPLTIILKYMIQESSVAMTIMFVFFVGWWLQLQTIYTPVCPDLERELTWNCTCNLRVPPGCGTPYTEDTIDGIVPGCFSNEELVLGEISSEFIVGIIHGLLFQHEDFLWHFAIRNSPEWTTSLITVHKALFHMVMVLMILMLVVSISADTLERLIAKSDLEWQFERAKLIRNMIKTAPTPPPLNVFVKPVIYLRAFINRKGLLCTSYAPYYIMLEEGTSDDATQQDQATPTFGAYFARLWNFFSRLIHRKRITNLVAMAAAANTNLTLAKSSQRAKKSETKEQEKKRAAAIAAAKKAAAAKKRSEWFAQESLENVINWENVVERYREDEAEESEDEYVDELGCNVSQLDTWAAEMWEEAEEIENVEDRIVLRRWLVEEIKDVVKSS